MAAVLHYQVYKFLNALLHLFKPVPKAQHYKQVNHRALRLQKCYWCISTRILMPHLNLLPQKHISLPWSKLCSHVDESDLSLFFNLLCSLCREINEAVLTTVLPPVVEQSCFYIASLHLCLILLDHIHFSTLRSSRQRADDLTQH